MLGHPTVADRSNGFWVEVIPTCSALTADMDDASLSKNIDMFENTCTSNVREQLDQIASLFGAGREYFDNQASPGVAERFPDQVVMRKLICHYLVTYG